MSFSFDDVSKAIEYDPNPTVLNIRFVSVWILVKFFAYLNVICLQNKLLDQVFGSERVIMIASTKSRAK